MGLIIMALLRKQKRVVGKERGREREREKGKKLSFSFLLMFPFTQGSRGGAGERKPVYCVFSGDPCLTLPLMESSNRDSSEKVWAIVESRTPR